MAKFLVAMAVGLSSPVLIPDVASAAEHTPPRVHCADHDLLNVYSGLWHAVRRQYHKTDPGAQGRNIRRWGLRQGVPARCRHLAKSVRTLRVLHMSVAQRRLTYTGAPKQPPSGVHSLHAGPGLASIAACESGGNPATNTGNGFYGKYQFIQSTFNAAVNAAGLGEWAGTSPHNAPEWVQDRAAAAWIAAGHRDAWPNC